MSGFSKRKQDYKSDSSRKRSRSDEHNSSNKRNPIDKRSSTDNRNIDERSYSDKRSFTDKQSYTDKRSSSDKQSSTNKRSPTDNRNPIDERSCTDKRSHDRTNHINKRIHIDEQNEREYIRNKDESEYLDFSKYKSGLKSFLHKETGIENLEEFWNFYDKFRRLQKAIPPDINQDFLFPYQLKTNIKDFTERLEYEISKVESNKYNNKYDTSKNKYETSKNKLFENKNELTRNCNSFILSIKAYKDFQQKSKFAQVKKLQESQKNLPIYQYKSQITESIKNNRVVLIAGDTGCGKSTQVPKYILEAGFNKIVCTQPRRLACVSLAKRVGHEMLSQYKDIVGYRIRFERECKADTKITFMTEGLLLRQISDEVFMSYDVIILDEVHERHLNADFLVGVMKCLLYKDLKFKLVLMSATINIKLFTDYFGDIDVIQVPGRLYPIDIIYQPIIRDPYDRKRSRFDPSPYLRIIQGIDAKYPPGEKGDLLVFLNGFSEINSLAEAVKEYASSNKNWIVLMLHSSLSLEEQDKAFDYPPENVRKCIISTNIAETSVTIDGIRFVIDSGKVNRMTYNYGINKLSEVVISQDSAKQRAGRAGRTGPGTCFRLYSEKEFNEFDAFTPAEIHLVPLDSLVLHMLMLGISDVFNFPFLEKPYLKSIEESVEKLKFFGALSCSKSIEPTKLSIETQEHDSKVEAQENERKIKAQGHESNIEIQGSESKAETQERESKNDTQECESNNQNQEHESNIESHERESNIETKRSVSNNESQEFKSHIEPQSTIPNNQQNNTKETIVDYLELTTLGEALGRLPVNLTIGKMLITSTVFENVNSVLITAALLSVQSPLTQRSNNLDASEARKPYDSTHGDAIGLLNYFREWLRVKQSTKSSKHWARKLGLEEQRFYEVTRLYVQFRDILIEADLLEKAEVNLTSGERAIRFGELKQLKNMRRELKNQSKSSNRKRLKYEEFEGEPDDKKETTDLKDVEFRILNDNKVISDLLDDTSVKSYKNLTLLKLIITAGLYPQIAIEDQFNSSKTVSERLYHTKTKNYMFLHPTSYFATHPEILELNSDDIEIPPPGYFSKKPLSKRHQLLIYQSILETKKVYMVGVIRMPALQTLLLFSKAIATNRTLTKFVFDDFILVDVPCFGEGKTIMMKALRLRKIWTQSVESRLGAEIKSKNNLTDLIEDLVNFMSTSVTYNMKRLLPADLKMLYNSNFSLFDPQSSPISNPFDSGFESYLDEEFGGLRVSENVIYDCLIQDEWEYKILEGFDSFECPFCNETLLGLSFYNLLEHEVGCKVVEKKTVDKVQVNPNSKEFSCEVCKKVLMLTSIEILKHRKRCK